MPAYKSDGTKAWREDFVFDENDWNCYKIGEQFDVDNDGENCIIYKDAMHSGREYYRMLEYKGEEIIEDIEIKKIEVSENEYEYYINSELSTEGAFLDVKSKYIGE